MCFICNGKEIIFKNVTFLLTFATINPKEFRAKSREDEKGIDILEWIIPSHPLL